MRGFKPKHNSCTREITSVIKLMYDEAWPNWKAISAATRDRMFDKWAEKFKWDKNDDALIKAIFNTRASKRLSAMMEDVRERRDHLTQWCRPELKKLLYHYWRLMRSTCITHTLKANKEQFADKWSSDIWSGTDATVDLNQVWRQTVSELSEKNRIFGIGGFLVSTLRTSVFAPQASFVPLTSPAPAGQENAVYIREQVHLLNQNIQDMARQLHESEERIQTLHDELSRRPGVRDAEVEALKEQLREELRLMQEHRRQMGVTGEQMHAGSPSTPQDPPLHPPAPPEDDDADYVDP
ncbi:hypothetical protein PIB30_052662 [Stylosanthes scabra]|uniref:Uncharacterized protein n=1 Tax=Stylosanthes scabra TaxID=79078 RepID=A0ABU6ZH24_9FABA|nr:hypothetical protein [Stylosanthes scabra]